MRRLRMLRERLWDSLSHIDGALLNGRPCAAGAAYPECVVYRC